MSITIAYQVDLVRGMILLYLVLIASTFSNIDGLKLRFTNVKCEDLSPDFCRVQKCRLAVIKRDVIALNIDVKLLKVPVNNVTVSIGSHCEMNVTFWGVELFIQSMVRMSSLYANRHGNFHDLHRDVNSF